jgi:exonuclease VII large subunit
MAVLKRGYAVITKNQKVVNSVRQVMLAEMLRVRLQDGEFSARVTDNG